MTEPLNAWEIVLLLRGLEWAYERCAEAHRSSKVPDPVRAPLAAGEFVGYACVLDEWLSEQKGTNYMARRNQDPDGRLLLGLRFARDRNVHQATLTAVTAFELRYPVDDDGNIGAPMVYPPGFVWRNIVDVIEPTGKRVTDSEYLRRRAAYETDLADHPALPTLATAQRFLTAEPRSHNVE